jgi:hypothetical protein
MCNQSVSKLLKRVRLQILEISYCAALNQMCEGADSQSKPEVHGFVHEFMLFKNVGVMSYDCPVIYNTAI